MAGKGGKGLLAAKTTAANKDKDKKKPVSRSSRAGLQVNFLISFSSPPLSQLFTHPRSFERKRQLSLSRPSTQDPTSPALLMTYCACAGRATRGGGPRWHPMRAQHAAEAAGVWRNRSGIGWIINAL